MGERSFPSVSRRRTFWMVALSSLVTAIVVMLAMSLGRSEKTVSRHLTHRFTGGVGIAEQWNGRAAETILLPIKSHLWVRRPMTG